MLHRFVKIAGCRNALAHNERSGGYCADSLRSTFLRSTSLNATTGPASFQFTKRATRFSCAKIMRQRSDSRTITPSQECVRLRLNRLMTTAAALQKMAMELMLHSLLSQSQALPPQSQTPPPQSQTPRPQSQAFPPQSQPLPPRLYRALPPKLTEKQSNRPSRNLHAILRTGIAPRL